MNYPEFPGHALRERREALGFSLQEVHRHTHVPIAYLSALEAGELEALPVETYTTGFIATYCEFLDLNPEPYLDRYRTCCWSTGQRDSDSGEPFAIFTGERPAWVQDAVTWAAICGILLLGWLTYAMVVHPLAEGEDQGVKAGTVEVTAPTHFEEDF